MTELGTGNHAAPANHMAVRPPNNGLAGSAAGAGHMAVAIRCPTGRPCLKHESRPSRTWQPAHCGRCATHCGRSRRPFGYLSTWHGHPVVLLFLELRFFPSQLRSEGVGSLMLSAMACWRELLPAGPCFPDLVARWVGIAVRHGLRGRKPFSKLQPGPIQAVSHGLSPIPSHLGHRVHRPSVSARL